jgi:hypothetical protein
MTEFQIKDEDLTGFQGKIVIVTGEKGRFIDRFIG